MMEKNTLNYLLADGDFEPDDLGIEVITPSRHLVPEVELMIEEDWANLLSNPTTSHFFDSGLWRYVAHNCPDGKIRIVVEPTSFKVYKSTNIDHPELFHKYGEAVMANPLIVAALVKTFDNYLLFARRSKKVALFQNQIHIIGGTVPRKAHTLTGEGIFEAMRNEIIEETGVQTGEIEYLRCKGLRLHMPYRNRVVIFKAGTKINAVELKDRVGIDAYEHDEFIFVQNDAGELAKFARKYKKDISLPLKSWITRELSV